MEAAQDLVQPQAEGAFAQIDLQLVAGLQAQLAQGKKPVGAVAQIFVCALAQACQRQRGGKRLRLRSQAHGECQTGPKIRAGRYARAPVQQQQLHQRAGQLRFARSAAFAPKNRSQRLVHDLRPGQAGGLLQVFALGQTHVRALARREDAGQVGGKRQVIGVAADQHHGSEGAAQGLVQGQDDQLFPVRIGRRESASLQAGLHPVTEVGQIQGRLRPRCIAQAL